MTRFLSHIHTHERGGKDRQTDEQKDETDEQKDEADTREVKCLLFLNMTT